jgi:hypothetical protein
MFKFSEGKGIYLGSAEKVNEQDLITLVTRHIVYIQPYYLIDLRKTQEILW